MKKLSTTLFLFALVQSFCFSQIVTIKELVDKSSCKEFPCFNDFISAKGFSYLESETIKGSTTYLYTSDKQYTTSSNKSVRSSNMAIITFNANKTVTVGTRTSVVEQYRLLMKQLKVLGFKSFETENIQNGVVVQYLSDSYPEIIISVITDRIGKENEKWTSYHVSVTNTK